VLTGTVYDVILKTTRVLIYREAIRANQSDDEDTAEQEKAAEKAAGSFGDLD
jgi:hypothetical protein